MKGKEDSSSHVKSVERALLLIDILTTKLDGMSLTEISRAAQWPKSTVHGLLATLRDYHMVDQSPENGHYRLGVRLFELGNLVARSWDIRSVALPAMRQMNKELGEMIQLATEDSGDVLYIEKLDSTHLLRIVSEIGARLPMHCSGLGKVMLAYKTPAEVKWIISQKGMRRLTSRTITDPALLEKELVKIRRQGYAVDDGEIMESLRCVAAPIFDKEGKVKYAISVSGIADSMQGKYLNKVLDTLLHTAEIISYGMGYRQNEEKTIV
jgi:Transcriptional regulator